MVAEGQQERSRRPGSARARSGLAGLAAGMLLALVLLVVGDGVRPHQGR